MRKLLLLVLVILLTSTVFTVSAFDDPDMTSLASYIQDDALMYASIRIDDSLVTTLDSLLERVRPFLPQDSLPPNMTTTDFLDLALQSANLGTFDQSIRPWLGDVAAMGIYSSPTLTNNPPVIVAVQVDGKSLLNFIQTQLADSIQSGDIQLSEENGYTIIESNSQSDSTRVAIGDDVLFIVSYPQLLTLTAVDHPLSEKQTFINAVNALPEDNYNMIAYVDMQEMQRMSLAQAGITPTMMPGFLDQFINIYGGIAMGFAVQNNEALVLDVAQVMNTDAYKQFGFEMAAGKSIDMNFTGHIPGNAALVLQTADFGANLQTGLENIRTAGDYIKANGGIVDMIDPDNTLFSLSKQERLLLNQIDLGWFAGLVNVGFAGATGLNLERDVLPVLDGDMALFVTASQSDSYISPVLPDIGLLFQNSDANASIALVDQFGKAAEAYDLSVNHEDYGNGKAIVVPAESLFGFSEPSLDIMLGSSDDVFAIGTRGALDSVAAMDSSLTANAAFQHASDYFIPDTQFLLYFSSNPLFDVADTLVTDGMLPLDTTDSQSIYTLASLLETASMSGKMNENGVTVSRLAITLSEKPRPLPIKPDA